MMNRQVVLLAQTEVKELFAQRRVYHFLPLFVIGTFFMAWMYPVGSPFAPIIVIVLIGLEPQFNNMLFRTPNELPALGVFPCPWKDVIIAKNLAALFLLGVFMVLASMSLLYFSPESITGARAGAAAMYVMTVAFPLLHIGNTQSLRHPRRFSGLQLEDLVQAVWMCVSVALLSVPYWVCSRLPTPWIWCTAYVVLSGVLWYRVSVRNSAALLAEQFPDVCLTE